MTRVRSRSKPKSSFRQFAVGRLCRLTAFWHDSQIVLSASSSRWASPLISRHSIQWKNILCNPEPKLQLFVMIVCMRMVFLFPRSATSGLEGTPLATLAASPLTGCSSIQFVRLQNPTLPLLTQKENPCV